MCYHTQLSAPIAEMEKQFTSKFHQNSPFSPGRFNGFTFPKTPVITAQDPHSLQLFRWGLLPSWAKEATFAQYTLNAKLETISEKPSFNNILHQRCLILANGFFEWQWLDLKGKQKQEFHLHLPNEQLFAFAGLWNNWVDRCTGEIVHTYTLLTTEANELMAKIHNTKKRMPIVMNAVNGKNWLANGEFKLENDFLIGNPL
jgi:putative SOS response-associated peptidase YedK